MKAIHQPRVDGRYWLGITLASVFGTNLGDFYAHHSGLGLVSGLAVLAALALIAFLVETRDRLRHDAYYWFVIIMIRTGATNIADYLAFKLHLPQLLLSVALALLIGGFGWLAWRRSLARDPEGFKGLPDTNAFYWAAMLSAGVFGTVVGDVCSHAAGEGLASIGLAVLLAGVLFTGRARATHVAVYWTTVAVARTAGTSIGDWLAENKVLGIGLPLSTLVTGSAFVLVLVLWRSRRNAALG